MHELVLSEKVILAIKQRIVHKRGYIVIYFELIIEVNNNTIIV